MFKIPLKNTILFSEQNFYKIMSIVTNEVTTMHYDIEQILNYIKIQQNIKKKYYRKNTTY